MTLEDFKRRALSQALRRGREHYSVSARRLAVEVGVDPSYISRIESGQSMPSDRILREYASRFRMDIDELSRLAFRIPPEVVDHLVKSPGAIARVRKEMEALEPEISDCPHCVAG